MKWSYVKISDILGRTYEYCLSMFAEQEGKRGGEFFTPSGPMSRFRTN